MVTVYTGFQAVYIRLNWAQRIDEDVKFSNLWIAFDMMESQSERIDTGLRLECCAVRPTSQSMLSSLRYICATTSYASLIRQRYEESSCLLFRR
jgi:hypothetical protein